MIFGLFFLTVGIGSMALPWLPTLQTALIDLILGNPLLISLFGLGFTLMGLSILAYYWQQTKRRHVIVRTGARPITLDESLIQHYVDIYWKQQFPYTQVHSQLTIKKNAIRINAELPFLPQTEQPAFLEKVRQDFQDIFGRVLGYPHEVYLYANFRAEPK